jgi:DNA-binding IclR family transcriptional regulator
VSRDQQEGQRHLVDRLFSILDAFTPAEPRLTVSDISKRTLIPVATAYRLATQLANEGALDRGDDGRYGIGIRLLEIARLEQHTLRLRSAALPKMLRLHEETGSAVLLCVLSGKDVVVIEHAASNLRADIPPRQAAASTAAGRLLLAHRPGCPAVVHVPHGRGDIAQSGLAFGGTQAGSEPFSVAAPVLDASAKVVAALSIVGLALGNQPSSVADAVKRSAAMISDALQDHASVVVAG